MKLTSGSICTDQTWQQFDSLPKYGGQIHVRQSYPNRGTSYLVVSHMNGMRPYKEVIIFVLWRHCQLNGPIKFIQPYLDSVLYRTGLVHSMVCSSFVLG